LLLEQNPTLLYLRNVFKELRVSSRSQGSTLPKMGLPRATAFRFGQGHFEAVFNFYLIAGKTKTGAPNPRVGACGNPVFGLRHDARNAAASKVRQKT
jgi:hypothetical protein